MATQFSNWGKTPKPIDLWIAQGDSVVDGTTLTIHGGDFYGISAVLFDSTPGTLIMVLSDTVLTVIVPSGGSSAATITVVGEYGSAVMTIGALSSDDDWWFAV